MGKKYLETKKDSLESSVLGVWKAAIEEGEAIKDAAQMTKEETELDEGKMKELSRKIDVIFDKMKKDKRRGASLAPFADKFKAHVMKTMDIEKSLEKVLPDYIAGKEIVDLMKEEVEEVAETNKNDKSDDGEGLDAVQPKAVKKKFKNRKDKDIDNDGDVDDSDKFLHKRRKAISKAISKEEVDLDDNAEEYAQNAYFKIQSMKAALAKVWDVEEGYNPFAEHKGTTPHKHPHDEDHDDDEKKMKKKDKTDTGKKPATIDLDPKINAHHMPGASKSREANPARG